MEAAQYMDEPPAVKAVPAWETAWLDAPMSLRFVAVVAALGACGGDDPPSPIQYGEMGPLAGDAGRDSWRFGAASAAAQIEEAPPNSDWNVWSRRTEDGGLGKGKAYVGDASRGYSKAIEDIQLLVDTNLDSFVFFFSVSVFTYRIAEFPL